MDLRTSEIMNPIRKPSYSVSRRYANLLHECASSKTNIFRTGDEQTLPPNLRRLGVAVILIGVHSHVLNPSSTLDQASQQAPYAIGIYRS